MSTVQVWATAVEALNLHSLTHSLTVEDTQPCVNVYNKIDATNTVKNHVQKEQAVSMHAFESRSKETSRRLAQHNLIGKQYSSSNIDTLYRHHHLY